MSEPDFDKLAEMADDLRESASSLRNGFPSRPIVNNQLGSVDSSWLDRWADEMEQAANAITNLKGEVERLTRERDGARARADWLDAEYGQELQAKAESDFAFALVSMACVQRVGEVWEIGDARNDAIRSERAAQAALALMTERVGEAEKIMAALKDFVLSDEPKTVWGKDAAEWKHRAILWLLGDEADTPLRHPSPLLVGDHSLSRALLRGSQELPTDAPHDAGKEG